MMSDNDVPSKHPPIWALRQRVPTTFLSFRNLRSETRWLLIFTTLYILAATATGLLIARWPMPLLGATYFTQDIWYVVFFKIGLLLIVPLVAFHRWGYRLSDLAFGWRPTVRSLSTIIILFAVGVCINAGRFAEVEHAWSLHPPSEALGRATLAIAIAFVFAGIPEEIVYRGMLQTRLEASWGRLPAILVSVLLFVAWHIPTRFILADSVEGQAGDISSVLLGTGVPVGIVALLFAVAWDRYRNLLALIFVHAGIDTVPVIASMLQSTAPSF
jgi:membrane protease YdiL (CAAX protease family)